MFTICLLWLLVLYGAVSDAVYLQYYEYYSMFTYPIKFVGNNIDQINLRDYDYTIYKAYLGSYNITYIGHKN